jgi:hypothetical protein
MIARVADRENRNPAVRPGQRRRNIAIAITRGRNVSTDAARHGQQTIIDEETRLGAGNADGADGKPAPRRLSWASNQAAASFSFFSARTLTFTEAGLAGNQRS